MDDKAILHRYLKTRRAQLLGKLDGLDEYDVRRPMTPTGTNLLGLVKHVASVELGYFGEVFGRPSERDVPWLDDGAEPDADMWATPAETRADIAACTVSRRITAMPPSRPSRSTLRVVVPWWPEERKHVTLQQILVHMCAETAQHLGHADILRELIDGAAGQGPNDPNLPVRSDAEKSAHPARLRPRPAKPVPAKAKPRHSAPLPPQPRVEPLPGRGISVLWHRPPQDSGANLLRTRAERVANPAARPTRRPISPSRPGPRSAS